MTPNYLTRERKALEDRIDELTTICRNQTARIEQLERYEQGGKYWLRMQNHIMNNENIRDAWMEFYFIYAMYIPNIEELK